MTYTAEIAENTEVQRNGNCSIVLAFGNVFVVSLTFVAITSYLIILCDLCVLSGEKSGLWSFQACPTKGFRRAARV